MSFTEVEMTPDDWQHYRDLFVELVHQDFDSDSYPLGMTEDENYAHIARAAAERMCQLVPMSHVVTHGIGMISIFSSDYPKPNAVGPNRPRNYNVRLSADGVGSFVSVFERTELNGYQVIEANLLKTCVKTRARLAGMASILMNTNIVMEHIDSCFEIIDHGATARRIVGSHVHAIWPKSGNN